MTKAQKKRISNQTTNAIQRTLKNTFTVKLQKPAHAHVKNWRSALATLANKTHPNGSVYGVPADEQGQGVGKGGQALRRLKETRPTLEG